MVLSRKRFVKYIAILSVLAAVAFAQSSSGELLGTIYDASGAVIPSATVTAVNVNTGIQTTTTTTTAGQYRLSNLIVGAYNLRVKAAGFAESARTNVEVSLNRTATVNFTLEVGTTATAVDVSDAAAVIDTTTANVTTSFDARQLSDLPATSSGSGVLNLSLLTAGVASGSSVGAGTGPSVGGQRPRNNNFTIEGIDNNSKSVTGPLVFLPNDAVAEFSVLANQFSPEFGHSSGGQFNSVIKSGTNAFHGGAYEYLQNRNLNSADNLSGVGQIELHPRYDDNRYGAFLGGPIKKNKLFFFGNFQRESRGQAGTPGQVFAPTAAGYSLLGAIPGVSQSNLSVLKQYLPPTTTAIAESATPAGAYPVVGGKAIPLGQMSVLAPNYWNQTWYIGSVDYTVSDKDSVKGRLVLSPYSGIDNYANLPAFFTTIPSNSYLASISEFHNFSPTLMNELRIGYNRLFQDYPVGPQKFPGLDAFPNLTIDDLNVNVGPDPNAPQDTIQNTYQGSDNLTWIKGAHTFKIGADFRKSISPQDFTQRVRGDYEWSTLDAYLRDLVPDFAERTVGNIRYYGDQTQLSLYANDDWKIRPNFTINLGLRYERTTLPYSERLQTVNSISNVPGLITFSEPKAQNLNFAPRVGFAWSPGKSGTTSIRGGFGINYDQLFDNLGILSLPPQFQQTVDVGGTEGGSFLAHGGIPANASTGPLSVADAKAGTSGFIPDQRLPKSLQWNVGIQHVYRENYTIEVRYLGTRGINLPVQSRINSQSVVTAGNALPLFMSTPSQATLDGLKNNLSTLQTAFNGAGNILPSFLNAGFESPMTAYMPLGNSTYHGLATQVTRRFHNGMQFVGAYTWSHNIDDSTAEVASTYTTPRRPQDFQNMRAERSSSALDHRQRLTFSMVYELPFFKNSGWFMKNIVGNWQIAPIYTYQTGTLATIQSGVDSNLNGDTWSDRAVINASGTVNAGSGTTSLTNSHGDVVAYLVKNPNARYIQAPKGVLPNSGRNTMHLNPINNVDFSLLKRVNLTERYKLELGGQFYNTLNHPQYTGGFLSDVAPVTTGLTTTAVRNLLNPASSTFYRPDLVFSSNPRTAQISAKFTF